MNVNAPVFVPNAATAREVSSSAAGAVQDSILRASPETSTRIEPPLQWSDGPLVWIDCEMTGLDYKRDRLLEIAVILTNGNLDVLDPKGISYIIKTDKQVLDNMHPWCVKQHGESGLTQACMDSPHTLDYVKSSVLAYIKSYIPNERAAVLAGNSVHADKAFLAEWMPEVVEHLHYRIVDVSTIKELCRRWYPEVTDKRTSLAPAESKHRALDDILGSIDELKFYRETIFRDKQETLRSLAG